MDQRRGLLSSDVDRFSFRISSRNGRPSFILQLIDPFLKDKAGVYPHLHFYRQLFSVSYFGLTFGINDYEVSMMKIENEIIPSVSGANVRLFVQLLSDI